MHKARVFFSKNFGAEHTRPADFASRENGHANPIAHADQQGGKPAQQMPTAHRKQERTKNTGSRN
jgi:hypothetical protein